jgi:hypothetical protein
MEAKMSQADRHHTGDQSRNEFAAPKVVDRRTFQGELDALRAREKAHTHEGDAIAAPRRRLPYFAANYVRGLIITALTTIVVAAPLFPVTTSAENTQTANVSDIQPLPRDLEIQLALSALPPQLRDNATVYVLNPDKGFEVARKGTNGFHAFVARTGDDAMQGAWPLTKYPEDTLYPISFDSAGAKANMRGFFDIAEMQAKGTQPETLKRLIQERYKTGYYKAPERAGCSYMLSPILRTYVNPDASDNIVTASVPHVMCYAPNVSTTEIGVMPTAEQLRDFTQHGGWMQTPAPFVIHHGPHGYLVHIGGVAEREAIDKEDEAMLARLCKIRDSWCLPAAMSPKH